jgi:hypothetical protein
MRLSQPELEKRVFEKFVRHTGINVTCFQPCDPPKPDILCETECGKLYFELTDNTAEQLQKAVHARKEAVRNKACWINPFPEGYKQKFTKHYETNSVGCELVIYFGIHPVAEFGAHFAARLQENIEWIRRHKQQSEFQKVWIYDYHQDRVLACVNGST